MGRLFGGLRGGLGLSVIAVGALLAASTGIVGATVVTMGLLSLPTMLRRGYDPKLATGAICASGTLGQIIPPSIVLVILGEQISNAYVDAQRAIGNWSPEPVSVGDLFAGALLPGMVLVGLYMLYLIVVAWLRPAAAPAIPRGELGGDWREVWRRTGRALVPPIILIVAVLGSILGGIATPDRSGGGGRRGLADPRRRPARAGRRLPTCAQRRRRPALRRGRRLDRDDDPRRPVRPRHHAGRHRRAGRRRLHLLRAARLRHRHQPLAGLACGGPRPRHALDHADQRHGVRHSDRRRPLLAGVQGARRRRDGARGAVQRAGGRHRRDARGHADHVRARLLPRLHRDHLRGGADHRGPCCCRWTSTQSGSAS